MIFLVVEKFKTVLAYVSGEMGGVIDVSFYEQYRRELNFIQT